MGSKCGSSPCSNDTTEVTMSSRKSKGSKLELEDTGILDVDSLFENSKEVLSNLIYESGKLRNELKQFQKLSCANMLKSPSLEDTIVAMLMAFSAGLEGDFAKLGLNILPKSPFIVFKDDVLRLEHQEIADQWIALTRELDSCLPTMERFRLKINTQLDLIKDALELVKSLTSGFKPADQVKAVDTVQKNINKFRRAHKLIDDVIQFQRKLYDDMAHIVRVMNGDRLSNINTLGIQAHQAGVYEPKQVVQGFWPEKEQIRYH